MNARFSPASVPTAVAKHARFFRLPLRYDADWTAAAYSWAEALGTMAEGFGLSLTLNLVAERGTFH